jgi:hypothetical protein
MLSYSCSGDALDVRGGVVISGSWWHDQPVQVWLDACTPDVFARVCGDALDVRGNPVAIWLVAAQQSKLHPGRTLLANALWPQDNPMHRTAGVQVH